MKAEGRITDVPGIGKKSAAELSSLGIRTLRDMILFPPRSYDDRRAERNLSDTTPDNPSIACRITVISHSQFPSKRSGMTLKATCMDDEGRRLELLCFNRPFMKDMLKLGSSWYITASAVERNRNGIYSTASFELKRTKEEAGIGRILPVYPLTGSITEKMLRNASAYAIDALSPFADELPYDLYGKLSLMHHDDAYKCIHYPGNDEDIKEKSDLEWEISEDLEWARGGYSGPYGDDCVEPASWKRSIYFVKKSALSSRPYFIIHDAVEGSAEHEYTMLYHVDAARKSISSDSAVFDGIAFSFDGEGELSSIRGAMHPVQGMIATGKEQGMYKSVDALEYRKTSSSCSFLTVISLDGSTFSVRLDGDSIVLSRDGKEERVGIRK